MDSAVGFSSAITADSIMFGEGISREGDILDLAVNTGVVNKSGAWYAYNDMYRLSMSTPIFLA